MQPTQLNTLPPEQIAILLRKKRFWKKTMWISLPLSIFFFILGVVYYEHGTNRAFSKITENAETIQNTVVEAADTLVYTIVIFLPLTALPILIFLVALIRCLSLPKLPPNS